MLVGGTAGARARGGVPGIAKALASFPDLRFIRLREALKRGPGTRIGKHINIECLS